MGAHSSWVIKDRTISGHGSNWIFGKENQGALIMLLPELYGQAGQTEFIANLDFFA